MSANANANVTPIAPYLGTPTAPSGVAQTPQLDESVEPDTPDGATKVVTDIVLETATALELERYIGHYAFVESW